MAINYRKIMETVVKYLPHPQAIELNKWIDALRKENDSLRDEIKGLKEQIDGMKAPSANQTHGIPSCPNCSTAGKAFFMSPIPTDFIELENATHECTRCKYKMMVK